MIPALLASVGLPLLVKAVKGALSDVDNPIAQTAAAALGEVDGAVSSGQITPDQIAEANRHVERMAEIDSTEAREALAQINTTMRTEAQSEDWYVRRWRPTFGYAVALTWVLTMAAIAWAIVADPGQAPTIIAALVNTSPIWGIALGVLGISVVKRSQDKAVKAGQTPAGGGGGLLGLLGDRLQGAK
ncbi:MAG: 3TM-type holin [Pseudomonadota bacterium]